MSVAEVESLAADGVVAAEVPLSYGQRALWFLERLAPGNAAYVIAGAAQVHGRVEPAALRRAAAALSARHPALRTTFHDTPAGPVQRVGEAPQVDFVEPDGRGLALPELLARLSGAAFAPFDFERGPLWRVVLLRRDGGHALALAIHHVVADFWSLAILVRELGVLYARELGLPSASLPPLGAEFAEAVRREEERLSGPEGERLWEYWRQTLAGVPLALDLPADRPRPAVQGYAGAWRPFRLPGGTVDRLRRLSRRNGATLYMALLAGFEALLGRYTGEERLVVGSPTTGRVAPELAGLVGYLVNPVAIVADLRGDPDVVTLLGRARAAALAAFAHQGYPFPLLAERLQPERDPGRSPVFQVLLVLQKGRRSGEQEIAALAVGEAGVRVGMGPLELESLALPDPGAQLDLTVMLAESGGELAGRLQYDRELFEPATIDRLGGHLAALLAAAAEEPGRRVSELPLLAAAERRQLVEWSGETTGYPRERTIAELFFAQAARAPQAVAVVTALGEALSYGELAARAGRLAAQLRDLGVGPEVPVGLFLERSPGMVVATLAVLAAGGAYVPLDPGYPAERLAFLLAEARVPLLLSEEGLAGRLPGLPGKGARVVQVDKAGRACDLPLPTPQGFPASGAGPESLAYVMFTSGSTGRPKGVGVVHRGVARLVLETGYARFGPDEVWLQLAPTAFDAATLEIWGALLHGGRLVLPPPGAPTLLELGAALARHGVTSLWLTAGLFHAMVEENLPALRPLRQLLAGGDVLSPAHVARALAALPETRLINGYGPTEGTTFTCCATVTGPVGAAVPLGRPIANTRVQVVDAGGRRVPAGVAGELWAGGDGLARGYLGRPELTAERFVPDPFGGAGERLYRTGDRVRWRPDGRLEFLGRLDRQVKIRGFRIEPGEVEGVLAGHPAVAQAAVVVREDRAGEKRLVAYSVLREEADLAGYLRGRLPEHLVPWAFVTLPALPLTVHGKLDRAALPMPDRGEPVAVLPRTPAETRLAEIWAELLGRERVGVLDDFFALGGHSLLATRLVSRVRQAFGVELPLRAVFEAPTVASLAARIESAEGAPAATPALVPDLVPAARGGELPLSFAQQRLWFLDQLEPGSASYNVPGALRLSGRLSAAALAAAFSAIVLRHEALRTTFRAGSEEPVQVIAPAAPRSLPLVDLAGLPARLKEATARGLAQEEAARPFDLERGPLARVCLLRLVPGGGGEAEEHVLLLTLHHIISDGWSLGVVVHELTAFYGAALAGRPAPLSPLAVQYADFALWQRSWLAGAELERQLAWWREHLAGAPALLERPADRPRPAVQSFRGGTVPVALPKGLAERLTALGRESQATLFMVLLSGFAALLGRLAGSVDLVVGSPVANRQRSEVEGLIGFFVNTLALRADLAGEPGFRDLLGRMRAVTLGAYAHQDVPFEKLVEELSPERSLGHSPLFQVLLALQNAPLPPLALPGLTLTPLPLAEGTAKFDLTLSLAPGTPGVSGVGGTLEYNRDLFDRTTAERLAGGFTRLLAAAVAAPEARLPDLPLLSPAERHQLVEEWNATPGEPGWGAPLAEMLA
ncbi:MAG: hypothetical protein QOJ16_3885, partial [Acidobacteriota bacterium]|nr:hypothetical protein [Acidobacteriota bacterium]